MASACQSDSTSPLEGVAGNYILLSANGELPLRFYHTGADGQSTIDIMSGTLAIATNGTFGEVLQYHVTPPTAAAYDAPVPTQGTVTVDGATITFTFHPPGGQPYVWTGTIAGSEITYTDTAFADITGGLTAVYAK
jgi:hypothetical protein